MKVYVVALCGILLATPALALPSSPTGSDSAEPSNSSSAPATNGGEQAREERQICRRIESDTSRRIGSRLICHTAEEWRAIQRGS